jgi:hypothetical protein
LCKFPKSSQIPNFKLKFKRNFFLSLGPSLLLGPAACHLPLSLGLSLPAGPNRHLPALASFSPCGPLPLRPASLPARLAHHAHSPRLLPPDSQKSPPPAGLASSAPIPPPAPLPVTDVPYRDVPLPVTDAPYRVAPLPVTDAPPRLLSPLRLPTSLAPSRPKRPAINAATTGRHRPAHELPPPAL